MSAARLPGGLAGLAHLLAELLEEVLAAAEAIAHHPRPDIAHDNEFHVAIGYLPAIGVALEVDLLDFDHKLIVSPLQSE